MTKVYVIMGNDYPSGVVSNKKEADRIIKEKMDKQKEKGPTRIYWRWYKFNLDELCEDNVVTIHQEHSNDSGAL